MKTLEGIVLDPLIGLIFLFFILIVFLSIYLLGKLQFITRLKKRIKLLNKIIHDLDGQTKLIIKSDMELKLYQQEIDSEYTKLSLIKNLILSSINILDKEELFSQINEKIINDLGFAKGLIFDFSDFSVKANVNFDPKEIAALKNAIRHKKENIKQSRIFKPGPDIYRQLLPETQLRDILAGPIKVKEDTQAIFIVANLLLTAEIKKSEEEAFVILSLYLSQCLETVRLFEDLYHTKDELERKINERTSELVKSLRSIEVISKAKSDFISSVSHELRTPLTSVKGFSSLLVEEKFGKLPAEAKKRLATIDDNVDKLMDIVNTLLDISRIESGKMEVKIVPFDIIKIIKSVMDFLTPQSEAKKIDLKLSAPDSLSVYIDKDLIERVLINLINNAIKFTPEGGSITVSCKAAKGQAEVSVSDTGCGIKKDDLSKVFQEFYRVSNLANTKIKGSGLGLSLIKRIIDTHKETIRTESEFGKGTTITFTLKTAGKN